MYIYVYRKMRRARRNSRKSTTNETLNETTNETLNETTNETINETINETKLDYANYKVNDNIRLLDLIIEGTHIIDKIREITVQDLMLIRERSNNQLLNRKQKVFLDDSFSKINYVPGLKTTLYRHQRTIVKALLDLENNRKIDTSFGYLQHTAIVLSEPVGSGKTIDILALILLSKKPKAIPDIMPIIMTNSQVNKRSNCIAYALCKYKKYIRPTLIFVGVSVMKQWQHAIKRFTDLKVFSITDVRELRKLFILIENREINAYDIVLVKNGTCKGITQPLPDDTPLHKKINMELFIFII